MGTNSQQIQWIKQEYNNLKKVESFDTTSILHFTYLSELAASMPSSNMLLTSLTQKLKWDLELQDFNEALYDLWGWLQLAEEKVSTNISNNFLSIARLLQVSTRSDIMELMKRSLKQVEHKIPQNYNILIDYYANYPLWGSIDPKINDYELFELRSSSLKEHLNDFVLLYSLLEDYRSKYCLVATLLNWLYFDFHHLYKIKEQAFADYFDLDILQLNENEVIADLGACFGDTLLSYLNTYPDQYSKYYCYEMSKQNIDVIRSLVQKRDLKNIVIREVAVGKEKGQLFFDLNSDPTSNRLNDKGQVSTDVVSIDEDIKEPLTFIKMDIEGAEQDALLGCKEHIKKDHPKLAISVYHNNEDIWKIARMIRGMDPTYRFYLRYNGGNLVPTETILFAV